MDILDRPNDRGAGTRGRGYIAKKRKKDAGRIVARAKGVAWHDDNARNDPNQLRAWRFGRRDARRLEAYEYLSVTVEKRKGPVKRAGEWPKKWRW